MCGRVTESPWHIVVLLVIDGVVKLGEVLDLVDIDLDKSEKELAT